MFLHVSLCEGIPTACAFKYFMSFQGDIGFRGLPGLPGPPGEGMPGPPVRYDKLLQISNN